MTNIKISFDFEANVQKFITLSSDDFIGKSYLVLNKIHKNWFPLFKENQNLLHQIMTSINSKHICPKYNNIFNAFRLDPNKIKLVLLGQDPYIKKGQAHGYSFSVPKGTLVPPSLENIFLEIQNEFPGKYTFKHGNLKKWSNQGIFLLNSALTTNLGKSNVHAKLWKEFTDNVIYYLGHNYTNKVFLLLGRNAQLKSILINEEKHKIISGVHPSPLSAYNGFFGSNIFLEVDEAIKKYGNEINWTN